MSRFSMLAYAGGPLNLGFWGRLVFDLDGLTHHPKLPALREHGRDRAAGVIDTLVKSSRELRCMGYFLDTADGREVEALIRAGFPMQASVGIFPEEIERVKEGEEALVNGTRLPGPLSIFRKSRLGEVSFVSLGADDATNVQVAASLPAGCEDWQTKPELRAQFGHDYDRYLAFKRAEAEGRVTICVSKVIKA